MSEHTQVGPYALGLLDPLEMSRFEEHLAECDECAVQLEWMLPVADQLADVEPGDLFGISGPSAFSTPVGHVQQPVTMAEPPARPEPQTPPPAPPPAYAPLRELHTPRYPNEHSPTAGPPTGQTPRVDPRTGQIPQVDPYTGQIPQVDPRTGQTPRVDPYTGQIPQTDPRSGQIPRIDSRVDPRTGEMPRVDPRTGEPSRTDPRTGEFSSLGPPTGENRIVPLVRGGDSRRRTQQQSRPAPSRRPAPEPAGRFRPMFMLAAAAAVLGAAVGAGAMVAGPWAGPDQTVQAGGESGPTLINAEKLSAIDAETGVHTAVEMESKPWGTLVSFVVSEVDGPRTCQLVAVLADGENEVLSTWTVPEQGYGEGTKPPELKLMAATAVNRRDISALQVQDVAPNGDTTPLVTIRS